MTVDHSWLRPTETSGAEEGNFWSLIAAKWKNCLESEPRSTVFLLFRVSEIEPVFDPVPRRRKSQNKPKRAKKGHFEKLISLSKMLLRRIERWHTAKREGNYQLFLIYLVGWWHSIGHPLVEHKSGKKWYAFVMEIPELLAK